MFVILQMIKVITVHHDLNMTIECVPMLALHSLAVTKMLNCFFNIKQVTSKLRHTSGIVRIILVLYVTIE